MSVRTDLTSPTIGTSTRLFFPISAGSISMWMTFACGAKVSIFPVTRSSNRAPMAIKRSHSVTAKFAYSVPCIPSIPRFREWSQGMQPRPIRVVVTGMASFVANSMSSGEAFDEITPPPA